MILETLILTLILGIISLLYKEKENQIGAWLLIGMAALGVSTFLIAASQINDGNTWSFSINWLAESSFNLKLNSLNALLCLLTSITFLIVGLITHKKNIERQNVFYGLMLLSMVGLYGVFLADDALVFYIFWELALIPVYFLCSMWGTAYKDIVSFKFFIYTFVGSLIMLIGLIYMQLMAKGNFSWTAFATLKDTMSSGQQNFLFWTLFIAFAIKMPIFPLHTWQPDTYKNTFTPVTMVLSAIMVKMGLYATWKWLIPIFPDASNYYQNFILILCAIGVVYASLIAMKQRDLKKLVAYSSIAHIALMCAALFASNIGVNGAKVQMFTHGINIIGMWTCVYFIERYYGTTDMLQMGGVAKHRQLFTFFLVLITLANIALPLTNGFVGEFMMFHGIFVSNSRWSTWITIILGLGIIFGAIYSLSMIQKVAYGEGGEKELHLSKGEILSLIIISSLILIFGFYPHPIIDFINK
jgi:NADH-quinone oxidoreductase subunit M